MVLTLKGSFNSRFIFLESPVPEIWNGIGDPIPRVEWPMFAKIQPHLDCDGETSLGTIVRGRFSCQWALWQATVIPFSRYPTHESLSSTVRYHLNVMETITTEWSLTYCREAQRNCPFSLHYPSNRNRRIKYLTCTIRGNRILIEKEFRTFFLDQR